MGCDIHLHVEVKIKGKWEHYNNPYISRNYRLFAKMAGVRAEKYDEPIAQPRGLPADLSLVTQFDATYWGEDGHSHSWLSDAEAGEAQKTEEREHPPIFGYLFGSYIDSYIKYPDEQLNEMGYEAARVVFWFDC